MAAYLGYGARPDGVEQAAEDGAVAEGCAKVHVGVDGEGDAHDCLHPLGDGASAGEELGLLADAGGADAWGGALSSKHGIRCGFLGVCVGAPVFVLCVELVYST